MKTEIKGSRRRQEHQSTDGDSAKIKLLKDEFARINHRDKLDKTRLLELFAFDVDERGKSTLVTMLGLVKWLRDIRAAPGGLTFMRLARAMAAGRIEKQYRAHVQNLLGALFVIIDRATDGDEKAHQQLQALNRIAFPDQYDVDEKMLEQIASHQPNAVNEISRGRHLLLMMDRIAGVVEPKLKSEFLSPDTVIIIQKEIRPYDLKACGDDLFLKVKRHKWNPKTTLRSLAVSIYLAQLGNEDATCSVDERMLRKAIALETTRQDKPLQGPSWPLNISQSPTEWIPFSISLLPLKSNRSRAKKTSNNSQI